MNTKVFPIERVDLQLINMFKDIRNLFLSATINLFDKFIVKGVSAGGNFAHRFTLLHPEYVFAAIAGGAFSSFTLLLESYNGEGLLYPNGMGNTSTYCDFNFDEYKKVKQFFYMGDKDTNDYAPYNDSYTEEEQQQIYRLFDKNAIPDRWNKYLEIYKSLHLDNIIIKLYKGLDHRPGTKARDFIVNYVIGLIRVI